MSTLHEFFESCFLPLFLRSRSPRTADLYRTTLRNLALHLGRSPTLGDLTDETVSRYLFALRQDRYSPYTVNKERNNLLAIWRFACRKGLLAIWPDVKAEPQPKRVAWAWTAPELHQLFAGIAKERGNFCGVEAAKWWRALHLIEWDTGERIGAVIQLRWKNVDLAGGFVLFPAETRKGGKEDRVFKMAEDTCLAMREIVPPPRELVFPWPFHPTHLWYRYARVLKRAGLPHDARSKFHRMRRSVASHYEAAGGNATELLGHTKRAITLVYLDPRIVKQQHASDVLFRPQRPAG